jgi:hypothetical protein
MSQFDTSDMSAHSSLRDHTVGHSGSSLDDSPDAQRLSRFANSGNALAISRSGGTAGPHLPEIASKSTPAKSEHNSLTELLLSAVYSAVAEPVQSIAQLVDHGFGAHTESSVQAAFKAIGVEQPASADFGTTAWHAQHIGSAIGMMLPYMLSRGIVRAAGARIFDEAAVGNSAFHIDIARTPLALAAREGKLSAITGATYGVLFHPVDNQTTGNFVWQKTRNGLSDSATFGAMGFSNPLLGRAMGQFAGATEHSALMPVLLKAPATALLRGPVLPGIASGVPAGFASAEIDAWKHGQWSASLPQLGESIYGMSFVGGAFGAAHRLVVQGSSTEAISQPLSTRLKPLDVFQAGTTDGAATSVSLAPKSSDNVALASSGDKPVASPTHAQPAMPGARLATIELLKNAQMRLSPESRDSVPHRTTSGYMEDNSGRITHAILRSESRPFETMAYLFHELTPFNSTIPVTVERSIESLGPEVAKCFHYTNTFYVQERIGKSFFDRLNRGSLVGANEQLRDLLEQAIAERAIIGDNDGHFGNLTVSKRQGNWTVGNIDITPGEGAFSITAMPKVERRFREQRISSVTLGKIETLVSDLDSPTGRKNLEQIGLSNAQTNALISRARFLLEHKRFPDVEAAQNPALSPELIDTLAQDANPRVRAGVAKNPTVDSATLETLAKDLELEVKAAVARNPMAARTFLESGRTVLEILAEDLDLRVRYGAASNSAANSDLLKRLSDDGSEFVRVSVAGNPATNLAMLGKLAEDPASPVRKAVAENPVADRALLENLAKDLDVDVRRAVAMNQFADRAVLENLAKDLDVDVRRAVAMNPVADRAVLENLAKDLDVDVRRAVAMNSTIGEILLEDGRSLLEKLASDSEEYVVAGVVSNPATGGILLKNGSTLLEALANNGTEDVRTAVAGNPAAGGVVHKNGSTLLEALASDESYHVREAVASNPATSLAVLKKLLQDKEEGIRCSVTSNPTFWALRNPAFWSLLIANTEH